MKSYVVHANNKYVGLDVRTDFEKFCYVYDKSGKFICGVVKDAAGQYNTDLREMGAEKEFDMSPLPKGTTFLKVDAVGAITLDKDHDAKKQAALDYVDALGHVPAAKIRKEDGSLVDNPEVKK